MDPQAFVERVREANKTPLSRLGSSKALYADTAGAMDDGAVLQAVATRSHFAAETYADWADAAEHESVADLFDAAATTERDHVDTVEGERDADSLDDLPGVIEHLRGVEGTADRIGAFVGWALAASKNTDQVVGYFVGQADPMTADTFRGLSDDHEDLVEAGASVLSDLVASGDADEERALEAAGAAIEADYDDYFETLEALGVNPKPVC